MAKYLLKAHVHQEGGSAPRREPGIHSRLFHRAVRKRFPEKIRAAYRVVLEACVEHRAIFAICFLLACLASSALLPWVGQDFFPSVDSGQFKLHLRAQTGTRIEETAALCDHVDAAIIARQSRPATSGRIIDNIGLPNSSINLSYSTSAPIGARTRISWFPLRKATGPLRTTCMTCGKRWSINFPE